jgi:hypothetical protein
MLTTDVDKRSCPLVSVVIVNYNSGTDLASCLESIISSDYSRKEFIIVDNASSDDSVERGGCSHSGVIVVRNPVNLGYSAAANIGITKSKGEFVVVMNPDIVVDPHWLDALVNAASRHPRAAFFQPKILLMSNPQLLNSAGNMIHIAGFGVCRGIGTPDTERFQEESEICYSSGACTLARVKALDEIGPMEELFFAYGEDKDWGWRGLMMGQLSIYVPMSRVLHKWSPTLGESPRKFYLLEFERLLSVWKNYSRRTLALLLPTLLIVEGAVLVYAAMRGWLPEKIRSYADLLCLRRLVAMRRKTVQGRRILPDRLLITKFVTEVEHPYIGLGAAVLNRLVDWIFSCVRNSI